MPVHKNYLDNSKDRLVALRDAIPKVIEGIKNGEIEPGFNMMFNESEDDGGTNIDRHSPCCAMGHLLFKAGLQYEINFLENREMPNSLFGDVHVAAAVQGVAVTNDADYLTESVRRLDLIHELEKLEGTIEETLERL